MILNIDILPIWISNGEKGIQITVKTENGDFSSFASTVPSINKWEPQVLEVSKAIKKVHEIKKEFLNVNEADFDIVDDKLEKLYSSIGSNSCIAISKACIKAASKGNPYSFLNPQAKKFPIPMASILCGGKNGGYCNIQNFFSIPRGAKSFFNAIAINYAFWKKMETVLKDRGMILGMNSEGAWIPQLNDTKMIELIVHHAERNNIGIGLDFSASNFYKKGVYEYPKIGKKFDAGEQLEFVKSIIRNYHITYVEDPFHHNDFNAFSELTKKTRGTIICGDDIFASQPSRIKKGIKSKAGNAFTLKLDKSITVSKALRILDSAKETDFMPVVSDRTIDTNDNFLADFCIATETPLLKYGISGGERTAKTNRFQEIWFDIASRTEPEMSLIRI
jgi:enolase